MMLLHKQWDENLKLQEKLRLKCLEHASYKGGCNIYNKRGTITTNFIVF